MEIREYKDSDEKSWIRCRVISFMDSSYFDDVQNFREKYDNPSVRLVATDNNNVIGFLDVEYENKPGDVCYFKGEKGGVIWHLGVLPEFRTQRIATLLWGKAKEMLINKGIKRIEVWTQDDKPATNWYLKQGFIMKESYLNAFVKGTTKTPIIQEYLNLNSIGQIYGVRSLNFEAPVERKKELEKVCYRLYEVRAYEVHL
jgi:ribosomal protein S18 acetylase RimI-like enzyme